MALKLIVSIEHADLVKYTNSKEFLISLYLFEGLGITNLTKYYGVYIAVDLYLVKWTKCAAFTISYRPRSGTKSTPWGM